MTAEDLRALRNKVPFSPFTIHMTDGKGYAIHQPDDLFIHPDWSVDAIVIQPGGRWSFIYVKNVASVSSAGRWPKLRKRRGRGRNGSESD